MEFGRETNSGYDLNTNLGGLLNTGRETKFGRRQLLYSKRSQLFVL